ncbi:MAG: hypothetical protein IPI02_04830 [Sterolibacteriaceae bacterium]|nr:hypothetical protein [Sterolibacteriaceae bacterium]
MLTNTTSHAKHWPRRAVDHKRSILAAAAPIGTAVRASRHDSPVWQGSVRPSIRNLSRKRQGDAAWAKKYTESSVRKSQLKAIENLQGAEDERLAQKRLALQRAGYEVSRAQRQYDAVDPSNRLVAGTLEKRWNDAMAVQSRLEEEIEVLMQQHPCAPSEETKQSLLRWPMICRGCGITRRVRMTSGNASCVPC